MLTAKSRVIVHHGWQIEITSLGEDFVFECYAPGFEDFCNDGEFYPDWPTALMAACNFIDREIAIKALLGIVEEWWLSGRIDEDEYWHLTDFA